MGDLPVVEEGPGDIAVNVVLAGAGSGKTRVLTYRIAYMLQRGINPHHILALTFTNKAAAEMRERIVNLVGGSTAKAVTMGTFHSVFYRILRVEAEKLGYTHNLTVYDTDDSKSIIKSIVKDMNLDPKIYAPGYVLNRISSFEPTSYFGNSPFLRKMMLKHNPKTQTAMTASVMRNIFI